MKILANRSAITVLTAITASIHFFLGINGGLSLDPQDGLNVLFVLNGLGYIYLLLAVFWVPDLLRGQGPWLRRVYIFYVLLTFVLYFVVNGSESFASNLGLFTKAVEILLFIGIWRSK